VLSAREVMTKAPLIANPDFVDLFVLARHDAFDRRPPVKLALQTGIDGDIATHRAVRADTRNACQFPGARLKAEILGRESPHRADIGRIAGEVSVESGITGGDDLQRALALGKCQHIIADNL